MKATPRCVLQRVAPGQAGVVLITGLIFMLILTLIALALLLGGTLEERMAANARNRQIALQAAEAVLRDAEVSLFSTAMLPFDPFTPSGFTDACTSGFCVRPATGATPKWKSVDWTSTSATRSFANPTTSNLSTSLVASQPRYVVEVANTPVISPGAGGGLCPTVVYRITARGVGQDSSEAFVQSLYSARPAKC